MANQKKAEYPKEPMKTQETTSIGFLGISFLFQLWNEVKILAGLPGLPSMQKEEEDSGPIL